MRCYKKIGEYPRKVMLTLKSIRNIHTFIFDFLGLLRNKEVIYKTRGGLKIIARTGSSDLKEIVIIHSDLEYPKRYFPRNRNSIIVDLGGHIGLFALYAYNNLAHLSPRIYVVEPSSNNFKYLQRNMKLNSFDEIKCFNLAIFEKDGKGRLDNRKEFDEFRMMGSQDNTPCEFETVHTNKLKSFCVKNGIKKIDLLKMDVEGAEHIIFDKEIDFLKKTAKELFVEVHKLDNQHNMRTFEEQIKNNNFEICDKIMNRTLFIKNLNMRG